jgi:hypothetical protein
MSWTQRTKATEVVKDWTVIGRTDRYTGPTGDVESKRHALSGGFDFQNGGKLIAGVEQSFERLVKPFAIRPAVVLPVADYDFTRLTISGNTDLSRPLNATIAGSSGQFWDGTSSAVSGTFNVRVNYHLTVGVTLNTTVADLPEGDFTATIAGTRVQLGFTPHMFLGSFLQYNTTTHQFSSNTRFNFIHHPLSDLFIVYNERRDTITQSLLDRALIVKFTNLFDF